MMMMMIYRENAILSLICCCPAIWKCIFRWKIFKIFKHFDCLSFFSPSSSHLLLLVSLQFFLWLSVSLFKCVVFLVECLQKKKIETVSHSLVSGYEVNFWEILNFSLFGTNSCFPNTIQTTHTNILIHSSIHPTTKTPNIATHHEQ